MLQPVLPPLLYVIRAIAVCEVSSKDLLAFLLSCVYLVCVCGPSSWLSVKQAATLALWHLHYELGVKVAHVGNQPIQSWFHLMFKTFLTGAFESIPSNS